MSARRPGFCVCAEPPQPGERERAVLVEERDDVGDGRERDEVEVPVEERVPGPEQRLGELPDDARPAEPGERIRALQRGDDGAVREASRRAGGGR